MKKIGFVGLGNMGTGMALNLQKAGAQVLAFDLDKDKLRELEAHGIIGCDSIKEVVEQVDDAIISMVRNREQTESVLFGENGVTSSSVKGKTVIVMSTLNPSMMTELERCFGSGL